MECCDRGSAQFPLPGLHQDICPYCNEEVSAEDKASKNFVIIQGKFWHKLHEGDRLKSEYD